MAFPTASLPIFTPRLTASPIALRLVYASVPTARAIEAFTTDLTLLLFLCALSICFANSFACRFFSFSALAFVIFNAVTYTPRSDSVISLIPATLSCTFLDELEENILFIELTSLPANLGIKCTMLLITLSFFLVFSSILPNNG